MIIICCDSQRHTLEIEGQGPITLERAREIYESGDWSDCTLSLHSLADCGWDWDALDSYYREMDGAR